MEIFSISSSIGTFFLSASLILLWVLMAEQLPDRQMPISIFQWVYTSFPTFACLIVIYFYTWNFKKTMWEILDKQQYFTKEVLALGFVQLWHNALWPVSLKHTTPAINSVIYFAYPTGIAIISIFVLNKRYRWITWAANGALFIGVCMVSIASEKESQGANDWFGIIVTLITMTSWSIYEVLTEFVPAKPGCDLFLHCLILNFWQSFYVFAITWPVPLLSFIIYPSVREGPFLYYIDYAIMVEQVTWLVLSAVLIKQFSSLFCSLVCSMLLPTIAVIDHFRGILPLSPGIIFGSLLVCFGFIVGAWEDSRTDHTVPKSPTTVNENSPLLSKAREERIAEP